MASRLESLFLSVLLFGFYVTDAVPSKNYVGVVGGEPVPIEEFPYQVSVKVMEEHACGGTIIHERFILTAGHCAVFDAHMYTVHVGTANIDQGGKTYKVERIITHEKYDNSGDYDLSIFKLTDKLEWSDKVAIAKLYTIKKNFKEGTIFNITGWGDTEYEGSVSKVLLRSEVPIVNQKKCKEEYEGLTEVTNRMFCAGADGHDACQGDSGGPLSLNGEVVGVVSRGKYCARKEYPTIYTKVAKFQGWIRKIINRNL